MKVLIKVKEKLGNKIADVGSVLAYLLILIYCIGVTVIILLPLSFIYNNKKLTKIQNKLL